MENKYISHKAILRAIGVPKIIKVGENLTTFWRKQVCTLQFFWDTVYIPVDRCVSPIGRNALYTFNLTLDGALICSLMVTSVCIGYNNVFLNSYHQSVSESDWLIMHILRQVLNIYNVFQKKVVHQAHIDN